MGDRLLPWPLLSLVVSGMLTACPGSLENPERFDGVSAAPAPSAASEPACGNVEKDILAKNCAMAGCHDAASNAAGLDLATADPRTRLLGKPAAGGGLLLVRGDVGASVLYQKVTSKPPFGGRMPVGEPLDAAEIDCFRRWLETPP